MEAEASFSEHVTQALPWSCFMLPTLPWSLAAVDAPPSAVQQGGIATWRVGLISTACRQQSRKAATIAWQCHAVLNRSGVSLL